MPRTIVLEEDSAAEPRAIESASDLARGRAAVEAMCSLRLLFDQRPIRVTELLIWGQVFQRDFENCHKTLSLASAIAEPGQKRFLRPNSMRKLFKNCAGSFGGPAAVHLNCFLWPEIATPKKFPHGPRLPPERPFTSAMMGSVPVAKDPSACLARFKAAVLLSSA